MNKIIKKISKFFKNEDLKTILREIKEYNENKSLIKNIEFDEEGNKTYEYIAEYNESNILIKEQTFFVDDKDTETKDYFYKNNELSTIIISSSSGWKTIQKYNYNESKSQVTIVVTDEYDSLEEKIIRIYNDKKQLIEESNYNEDDKLISKTKIIFSDDNKITQQEEYNDKDKIEKTIEFIYNSKGQIEKTIFYNYKRNIIDWQKIDYDENGRINKQENMEGAIYLFSYNSEEKELSEQRFLSNGIEILNKKTKFDDSNNIIEELSQSINGKENYSFEYEYF